MRVLFVTLFLPLEKAYHAGGRYVFEVLKNLSEKHDICLVTRLEEGEFPSLEALRPFCREIYPYPYRTSGKRGPVDILRLMVNYLGFSRYADRIARTGAFDIIQVEWVEAALLMKKRHAPMVLDAHDVITKPAERTMEKSRGLARIINSLRYRLLKTLELRTVRTFDRVFTLSEFDKDYLLRMAPGLSVTTVPVPAGLDIEDRVFERRENTILFLASYKYRRVNVDAALYFYRSVLPLVRRTVPDAQFIIAGYGPPEELTSLQDKDRGVFVTGFIENLDECYKRASVFVAPVLVGGGIIVKVLDAMAAGTPVVTTTCGNEGIGALPGRDLLVADEPEEFAASVARLLRDPGAAEKIAKNGQDFVRRNFSLGESIGRIESAYEELSNRADA